MNAVAFGTIFSTLRLCQRHSKNTNLPLRPMIHLLAILFAIYYTEMNAVTFGIIFSTLRLCVCMHALNLAKSKQTYVGCARLAKMPYQ
jgi:hypothetical protein